MLNQKKISLGSLLLMFTFMLPLDSQAGIPVIDFAGIAQMITEGIARANEFKMNIDVARNRLEEMKNQASHYKAMVEGHYSFEEIINDPLVSAFMTHGDWKDILRDGDINNLRDEFNMHSDDPEMQRDYDNILRQHKLQRDIYKTSIQRNKHMQNLLSRFNSATTPAAKSDIANSLLFEQVQLQNDTQMLLAINNLMEKQRRLNFDAKMRAKTKLMLSSGIPAPPLPPFGQ